MLGIEEQANPSCGDPAAVGAQAIKVKVCDLLEALVDLFEKFVDLPRSFSATSAAVGSAGSQAASKSIGRSSSSRFISQASACHPVWLGTGVCPTDRSFHESPEKAGGEGWLYSEQQQKLCTSTRHGFGACAVGGHRDLQLLSAPPARADDSAADASATRLRLGARC